MTSIDFFFLNVRLTTVTAILKERFLRIPGKVLEHPQQFTKNKTYLPYFDV